MSIRIIRELVEATYTMLQETAPFNRWNLPAAEDVMFKITRSQYFGRCLFIGPVGKRRYVIEISAVRHRTVFKMMGTLAHEMCHIHQDKLAPEEFGDGKVWKKLADQVCKVHQFDRGSF